MVGVGEMIASAVVKEVCSKLAATVTKEVALQSNTAADLESMKDTLSSIQDFLVDAEQRSIKEKTVRLWLKKLKATAYDIEDMLVDYEAKVPSHEAELLDGTVQKGKGWFDRLKSRYLKPQYLNSQLTIPHRMKTMRERLEKIKKEADISKFDFKYGSSSDEEEVARGRQTTSNACDDFVGRVEEKKRLMRLLLADEPSIIPIYGFGGIGKTTLAQMVYNDKEIEKNFNLLCWVYVSMKFDLEMIGRSIISESKKSSQNVIDLELVTRYVKSYILRKKFLIILDDLWEEDQFNLEKLMTMFKGGKKGSKIIVTTRSEKVAKLINSNLQFKMDVLPDNDCWTLFKSKAFKHSTMDVNLQNIGKEIVKKCNGVPLAAKSIGFLLRDKEVTAWKAVRDSHVWDETDDGPLAEKKVLPSLKLSYYNMPSYLRLCFAYCAVFPKGSDIDKHSLINQWIALGFIQPTQGSFSEEYYAELYLKDLLEMSFLQVADICSIAERYSKPTRVLSMHDLIHDLARSIAGDEVFVLNGVNRSSRDTAISYCRYASVTNYDDPSTCCKDLPSRARALHFRGCSKMKLSRHMFSFTKFLRVLDLSGCSTGDLPSSFSQLMQLKYLDCSGLQIRSLPSSMRTLQNLEVLNLSYCASLHMLPTWIGSFPKLRHLDLHCCSGLSELPECISELSTLRYLDVSACSRLQMLPISLGELENLSSLNLSECTGIQILPQSFCHLTNLTDLNLSSCLRLEQLPPLSPRHHDVHNILNALDFCDPESPEGPPEFDDGGLMKLERLDLANCINLREIPESYGTLSRLRFLNLSGCYELENILNLLAQSHFTNLEYLNLSCGHEINESTTIDNSIERGRFVDSREDLKLSLLLEQVGSMVHLKYLSVGGVTFFSEQGLGSLEDLATLPKFYVSRMTQSGGVNISNIFILQQILDTTHHHLYISGIQNVESPSEARRAELAKKNHLKSLELSWSGDKSGDRIGGGDADINILEELRPHQNLVDLSVKGYRGSTFIGWMADISNSLPQLTKIQLYDLPKCGLLPKLGRLPNLREVDIERMPGITNVGLDIYGDTQSFQRLEVLRLSNMDNLEKWTTPVLQEDVAFPNLRNLIILSCAKLRFEPFIPRSEAYDIKASNNVLSFERALEHSKSMLLSTMLIKELYFDGCYYPQCLSNPCYYPQCLSMFWSTDHARTSAQDEDVLANLQPSCNLERLLVQGYMGTRFTGWASMIYSSFRKIVQITLSEMPRCMHLPPLGLLPNLKELDISDIENLEEWSIMQVDDQEQDTERNFRKLHTLRVRNCPKLIFKPSIPASVRYYIQNSSEVLSSFDRPTSQRKLFDRAAYGVTSAFKISMEIDGCKLSCDEWKGLQYLRSLEELTVKNCPTLITLPESIQGLHSLQKLHIHDCQNFSTLPECLEHLSSLKEIRIDLTDRVLSFPQSIQRLSSLQTLNLWGDEKLEKRYRSGEDWSRIMCNLLLCNFLACIIVVQSLFTHVMHSLTRMCLVAS